MKHLFSNSIKRRFILAYSLFITFSLFVLLFNYTQKQQNISNLKNLQKTFFPLDKQINTYSHYLHLHESFSLNTIINNYDRKKFLHSLTAINPKFYAEKMQQTFDEADQFIKKSSENQNINWLRIYKMFEHLQQKHDTYQKYIYKLANHIQIYQEDDTEDEISALSVEHQTQSRELNNKKTEIINRISSISKIIRKQIETSINENIRNERNLFRITLGIALLMIVLSVLALQIGLQALKPFSEIKKASDQIKSGQYDLRLDSSGPIEFQEVSQSFNAMAQSLEERNAKIDQQHLQILHTQKLATIGEMSAKINHEIRNPLNAIQLNLELLLDENISEAAKKNIQAISSQIDRLFSITETYLQTAKKDGYKKQNILLDDFLKDLQQFFRTSLVSKKLSFTVENKAKLKNLFFDESLLFQALLNIIKNAIDACKQKDALGLTLEKDGSFILFKLWNTGQNIPPNLQHKIFDAFYTTKKAGSGLGLSITKDLLNAQNADVYLESSTDKKTTFILKIPHAEKK